MKFLLMLMLAIMTSCSLIPFFVEEIEDAVEFEEDAIKHEIELREKHHNETEETAKKEISI